MKTMKALFCLLSATLIATAADAATDATAGIAPPVATSTTIFPSVTAPKVGPFTVKAGLKAQETAGRTYELQNDNGRNFKVKNEAFFGLVHSSGWGLSAMAVQSGTNYGEGDNRNLITAGDPSLTVIHPNYYEDADLKLSGQFRRYFAQTASSKRNGVEQYAYYLNANYKMAKGVSLFNQLTPRYFSRNSYRASDTKQYVEDFTALTKQVNPWFRYGIGQHAQMEWHERTDTGSVIEIYPLVNFVFSSNFYIEPRVNMPIYKKNQVYDSPTHVALDNAQAEIYMQLSM